MLRPPFFLLPDALARRLALRFKGLGIRLLRPARGIRADLRHLGEDDAEYGALAIVNALFLSLLLFALLAAFLILAGRAPLALFLALPTPETLLGFAAGLAPAIGSAALFFTLLLAFFVFYPRILARKVADLIDKDLVYALKELQVQLGSGVSLFQALATVARGGYGLVSAQFDSAVKDINAGEAEDRALEKLADRVDSELFRRALWQLVTALRGGGTLEGALESLIDLLKAQQQAAIKQFGNELNLFALVYLIFAIAVPGLATTLLIVVSSFGTVAVTEFTYLVLLTLCFTVEIIIIGFIKNRRPAVYL